MQYDNNTGTGFIAGDPVHWTDETGEAHTGTVILPRAIDGDTGATGLLAVEDYTACYVWLARRYWGDGGG